MSFLSPIYFIFSFFLIPIILLHLLKKKYVVTNISSTFLWNKQIKNIEVNKSFEKIKKWLLLILQLLIIISLIMFLVKPYIKGNDNKEIINILIDNSASMEENIDEVKKDTIKLVNSFNENTLINIYTYNEEKELIISSFSKKQVVNEIKKVKLTFKKDDLSLVLNTFDNKKEEDYYIFTDRFAKVNQDNIYFQIYENSDFDISIENVSFIRNGEYTDLGIRIKNYSSNDEIIDLILYSNGEMDQVNTISIKKGETQLYVFNEIKGLEFGKVEIDIDDDIKFNNERYFSVKENKKKKVLLISDNNIFLQKALINNENIELYKSNKEIEKLEGYDLYVIDSSDKVFNVDNGAVLSFNSEVLDLFKFNKFDLTGQLLMNDKELFQYLKGEFYIEKSNSFIDSENHKNCGLFDSDAIVIKGISNNIKYIALGFDIYDTDFPITPDFPVFIDHSLNYLLEDIAYYNSDVLINDKVNNSGKYEVIIPSGDSIKNEYKILDRGIYLLKDSDSISYISANIDISEFNQSEKKIDSSVTQEVNLINIKKDISKWFLVLALCLLIIEWLVYKYEK